MLGLRPGGKGKEGGRAWRTAGGGKPWWEEKGEEQGGGEGGGARGRRRGRSKGEEQGGGARGRSKGEEQGGGEGGGARGRSKGEEQGEGARGRSKGEEQGGACSGHYGQGQMPEGGKGRGVHWHSFAWRVVGEDGMGVVRVDWMWEKGV
ncbi:unnamed protein product [Closterium sp. NIES-65]|nr:unnamed protein product [Closterium sp. NIES-65]